VDRIWLQTWFALDTAQDRAAFRFTSVAGAVTIELPPQVADSEVEALLDGQPANVSSRSAGRLNIAIEDKNQNNAKEGGTHTLELRYRHPRYAGFMTRQQLTPPQLVGTSPLCPTYWQIVLTGDEQLVKSPAQLVALDDWQWLGTFWGRRPIKSQADLESWVGATVQPAPSRRQSEYLFSGFAPIATVEVVLIPRWTIVLVVSGVAFLGILAWTYVAPNRRTWVGIGFALLIATMAIAYPTAAVLVGQAAILGLAGSIVAFVWRQRQINQQPSRISLGSTQLRLMPAVSHDSAITPQLSPTTASVEVSPEVASEGRE
jgi:hypothetical protein